MIEEETQLIMALKNNGNPGVAVPQFPIIIFCSFVQQGIKERKKKDDF